MTWTSNGGQKEERTECHLVEVFGKPAQVVRDYLTKGRQVYFEGSIRYDEWTDKDGNKRNTTKIHIGGPEARRAMPGGRRGAPGGRPPARAGPPAPGGAPCGAALEARHRGPRVCSRCPPLAAPRRYP